MNNWISITEKLPALYEPVLPCTHWMPLPETPEVP